MSVFTNPATAAKHEAEAYVSAVLHLLGDKDSLKVLDGLTARIEIHMSELSATELKRPETPGKWSVLEVIQHLADSELVWAFRLRTILAQDGAKITGYDQDGWARQFAYGNAEPEQAFEQVRVLRSANMRLLRSLSDDEFERVGVHDERGEESVRRLMRLYAGHDLVHLRQIARIRDTMHQNKR